MNDQAPVDSRSTPGRWWAMFGPGAIVASLSIGSGELVFSSRGGALFGYRLLGLFLLICLLKWALVLATARHLVLTGKHPFERWARLPGPRGWLPIVFLMLAAMAFPIWVGFLAGTVGTLLAALTDTQASVQGGSHFIWGLLALAAVMMVVWTGSYQRMERLQMTLIFVMLACVSASMLMLRPNLVEMLGGIFSFSRIEYPSWASPEIRSRAVWVELATYVGVVGGSGYDYLAYTSYVREKQWGNSDVADVSAAELDAIAADAQHPVRRWLLAPWVDASLSFAIVFVFSAIFLTCGTLVLRPLELVPDGSDLLTLQAEFVRHGGRWMQAVYFGGALLAMLGTLYGTIEVAPAVVREIMRSLNRPLSKTRVANRVVTGFVAVGGAIVLLASLSYFLTSHELTPPALITILTPANLFTGVLACGFICILALWSDARYLPPALRMPKLLASVVGVGGCLFFALGVKAYWDHASGGMALAMLIVATVAGMIVARYLGGDAE